jgi:energy-coupling factor transporter ATP-binding protein EcfA2
MKLEKLILVNWGALRPQEYSLGNMTLLTGQTGAGKSTWLDALQTVMTAAYQGIFSYNPGQDETTQGARNGKSKRSLWSYIAGGEDNLFARPDGAHGYVAAVFQPSEGEEGKSFTALVAAAARVEGSGIRRQAVQERLALLIVDDAALSFSDLVLVEDDGGMQVVPVESIQHHLKTRYSHVTNYREVKRDYLSALYGRFRGLARGVSFPEAEQAARAWVQSIAYRPIGSVDELVKTQILEHNTQLLGERIGHISDLMRQVSQLRADGERLKANITRLEHVAEAAERATNAFEEHLLYQTTLSKRTLQDNRTQQERLTKQCLELERRIGEQERAAKLLKEERALKDDSRIHLRARLAGLPAAGQKQQCEEQLARAEARMRAILAGLISNLENADALLHSANRIAGYDYPTRWSKLAAVATQVAQSLERGPKVEYGACAQELHGLSTQATLDAQRLQAYSQPFLAAQAELERVFELIAVPERDFVAAVYDEMGKVASAMTDTSRREKEVAARKAALAGGGADYPAATRQTLSRLKDEIPACRPQVLCDLIEPVDPAWQPAIEGYMSGARFNIIVEPDWETRAIDLARRANLGGKIVQGELCKRHARDAVLAADSIVHELATEHPIAKAYLTDMYGRVVKVSSSEQLRFTSQGVTQDGRASGGRTMFIARSLDLVFGKEAQRRARERAEQEHAELERELEKLSTEQVNLQGLLALAGKVKQPDFSAVQELDVIGAAIDSAHADLACLDLSEVSELEAQAKALSTEIDLIDQRLRDIDQEIGGVRTHVGKCQESISELQAQSPAKQQRHEHDCIRLRNLCMLNGALSYAGLMELVDQSLKRSTLAGDALHQHAHASLNRAHGASGDVQVALADYNLHARADERFDGIGGAEVRVDDFVPTYGALVRLLSNTQEQLRAQRDIGLVKNLDQLRQAEESFKDVFTKQFCAEIRNAVDTGTKTLRQLNDELERLKFGTDRFRIDWSEWVPEYKAYYEFFCAAYELGEVQEALSLFATTELSAESCRVRDHLVGLLLSNDQEQAVRELQRIADYRNYRRYEIWKESDSGSRVALSEWGTGSGGQLETPAYIVRAAIVTNRLKHFEKGMNLKLLVNDESFSKMDERRAHDVMRFLRDNLGMQLVCAMPTIRAGALKSAFNKEWCFSRADALDNGEVGFVSEPDERDLQPDRLTALWEQRRAQVREQARIAFEESERAA